MKDETLDEDKAALELKEVAKVLFETIAKYYPLEHWSVALGAFAYGCHKCLEQAVAKSKKA